MTYITPVDLYTQVLALLDYQGDVDQFLEDEEYMNYVEASMNLYKTLEKEKQSQLKSILEDHDLEQLEAFYKEHFGQEQFSSELKRVTEKSLREMVKRVLPLLKPDTIRQLDSLLGSQISY